MSKLHILHISDVHWSPTNSDSVSIITAALLRDLETFKDKGISPHFIVFSGDLVQSGSDPKHFQSAYDLVLSRVLKQVGLTKNRLFICPGNHDIDRDEVQDYVESGLLTTLRDRDITNRLLAKVEQSEKATKHILDRLKNYNHFMRNQISKPPNTYSSPLLQTYRFEEGQEEIGIAVF